MIIVVAASMPSSSHAATAFCATLVGVATAGQNDGGRLSESEG
jgi:hypothetical protein